MNRGDLANDQLSALLLFFFSEFVTCTDSPIKLNPRRTSDPESHEREVSLSRELGKPLGTLLDPEASNTPLRDSANPNLARACVGWRGFESSHAI